MTRIAGRLVNVAVILASTVLALVLAEVGLRLVYLKDPWTVRNFTADEINHQVTNISIKYDPILSYIPLPHARYGWSFTIGEHGIHLNKTLQRGVPSPPVQTGGILTVGDSFVFGSEVGDDQSWPAQLEHMVGMPVVNAGVGGYGYDQAILRAEQLLDIVKPRLIIVGCIPNCVGRNTFSVNSGLIKPYFDIVDGKLALRNVPVPTYVPKASMIGEVRAIFGRSYLVTWVADRIGYGSQWKYQGQYENRTEHNYGDKVLCLLWKRLAERVAGRNTHLMTVMQYAGLQVAELDDSRKSQHVEKILACARKVGFETVDTFHALRKIFETDKAAFWNNWVKESYDKEMHTGHMSKEGNRLVAELVYAAIRKHLPNLLGHEPTSTQNSQKP